MAPIDFPVRQRALDITQSFLVQAPAGSGKTELLTQRFLALLATVEQPESIVAITFTRKAAGEMRNRIAAALRRAATEPEPESPHARTTWRLGRAALDRDADAGWQLMANPGRLRILTIDALAASLAGQMPWMSRMGGVPNLATQPADLHFEAAVRTLGLLENFDLFAPALEKLLLHLDNNHSRAVSLLMAMLGNRDQWLRHVSDAPSRAELEAALRHASHSVLRQLVPLLPPNATSLLRYATAQEHQLTEDPDSLPSWRALAGLLLTGTGSIRRSVNKQQGFPPGDPRKPELELLLRRLDPDFAKLLWDAARLPSPAYSDAQWEMISVLFDVLKLATAQLQEVFREKNQSDFIQLSLAALTAIGPPEAPTPLAYALDYRLQHLLIDEFQDTSITKLYLLERLTGEWAPGDGHTIFAVGDPMQSIYGFQEADVSLFERCRRDGLGQLPLEFLQLTSNFRSSRNLVSWFNEHLPAVLERVHDPANGAIAYAPCEPQCPEQEGTPVVVHPIPTADAAEEARQVADLVQAAKGSVAILVRKRPDATAIVRELQARGVVYQAVEMDALAERSVVQDLRALTRALLHPAERTAWLAVLRAPYCGLSLEELLAIGKGPVLESLAHIPRLSRVAPLLQAAIRNRRRMSLRRLVRETWTALGGPACARDEAELQDAETFFEALDTVDASGELPDFRALDQVLQRLAASPNPHSDGRVQVMTMHKAKGLEFDEVILPGLGNRDRAGAQSLLKWRESREGLGEDLLIGCVRETGGEADAVYDYLSRWERKKEQYETGRLLYVACTRARKTLHLVGWAAPNGEPQRGTMLERLWPAMEPAFRAAAAQWQSAPTAPPPLRTVRRVPLGWIPEAAPAGLDWATPQKRQADQEIAFDWSGETVRTIGTVVHRVLHRCARGVAPDASLLAVLRAQLSAAGVPAAELRLAVERAWQAIQATYYGSRGKWILHPHAFAESEWELRAVIDKEIFAFQLDRTFVDEHGTRWIIDYKTGWHEGADLEGFLDREQDRYRAQLERYASIVSRLENRPIRLGLYFPLLDAWREWPYAIAFQPKESMTVPGVD